MLSRLRNDAFHTSNGSCPTTVVQDGEFAESFSGWKRPQNLIIYDDLELALGRHEQMIARLVLAHDKLAKVDVAAVHRLDELSNLNAVEVLEEVILLHGIFDLLLGPGNEISF